MDIQAAAAAAQLGMGKVATRLGTGTGTAAAPTWLGQVGMFSYVDTDGVAGTTIIPAAPLSRAAFPTHAGVVLVPSRAGAGDPSPPRNSTKWS
uniref:Uncharacterized protein n=1 Tax=Oryza glumipatula TaxID=40148 RepID=A0A0E0ACQ6_9ORYZ